MKTGTWLAIILVALATCTAIGQNLGNVEIKPVQVGPGLYMLTGSGGNIGLSIGLDGAFIIDDQYAPLTEKIVAAIRSIRNTSIHFVVNTHWHGDHTGGNENLGKAGVLIVAHENVRKRMSVEQFMVAFNRRVPPSPEKALPVVTFTDAVTFHWNGEEIHVFHIAPAHTDGDSIIHFRRINAFHMGDTFFNGMYPFVDVSAGGSINGVIAAADRVLELADENTRIMPGHGPVAARADLEQYRDMLVTARDAIVRLKQSGMSRDEVVAAQPTASLDERWGKGFMQPDVWVGIVYDSLGN